MTYYYVANLASEKSFARKGSFSVSEAIQTMFDDLDLKESGTYEVVINVHKQKDWEYILVRTHEVSVAYEYEFDPDSDTQPHTSSWIFNNSVEGKAEETVKDSLLLAKELMEMGFAPASYFSEIMSQLEKLTRA